MSGCAKVYMQKLLILPLTLLSFAGFSQPTDSTSSFSIGGFADVFYQYDLNQPAGNARPGFLYNHNRHNEVNVNLAYIKGAYTARKLRANLALMVGTYADDNLAAETNVAQHIYEANIGIRLGTRTWVDAGIMPSHIGFEGAQSAICRTLTRSLLAENSPYFETGVKLSYQPTEALTLTALYLNGFQRIARPINNSFPAFGTQITWKPRSNVVLNYSTFFGSDKPDDARRLRHYQNFYGIFTFDAVEITAGIDFAGEQARADSSQWEMLFSPIIIARYQFAPRCAVAARAEYYDDQSGIIIGTGTPNGFQTLGLSLNFDYKINDNALWRIEGRFLSSEDEIFVTDNSLSKTRPFMTTSLAVLF